jgi:hypothetical protein
MKQQRCPLCMERCGDTDEQVVNHMRREHDKTRTEAQKILQRTESGKSPEYGLDVPFDHFLL